MSQSELAELVGVSNKAVSKWETYEANPDITLLPLLAVSLGVTTDVLLSDIKSEKTLLSRQRMKRPMKFSLRSLNLYMKTTYNTLTNILMK